MPEPRGNTGGGALTTLRIHGVSVHLHQCLGFTKNNEVDAGLEQPTKPIHVFIRRKGTSWERSGAVSEVAIVRINPSAAAVVPRRGG